jgi:geranylgeranyl diphosphate synthase type I
MAQHKTGALLSCACLLGALAGGGSDEQVEHLGTFGALLGLAFQYADDLQGIWGTSEVTGKPAQSDLRNRKKSLPIVAALTSDTDAGAALCQWYRDEGIASTPDFVRIAGLVEEAGGRHWGEAELERLCAEALDHLQAGSVNGAASAELTALADLVLRSRPQRDQGPPPAS